jgi:hypothetical protein
MLYIWFLNVIEYVILWTRDVGLERLDRRVYERSRFC